jgi:alkaline phosphatase
MKHIFNKRLFFVLASSLIVVSMLLGLRALPPAAPAHAAVAASGAPITSTATAKYVFLFIGDGMAVAQRNAAELFLAATKDAGARPETVRLLMNQFPAQGMTTTYDLSSIITDSASAGTALATGHKTNSGVLNMDPTFKDKYTTIAEVAKAKGWKVGIVTSVSLDHATPAAFYAHQNSRKNYYDIALELGKSDFDYLAGGGLLQPTGKDKDKPDALQIAKTNGYTLASTRADFDKLAAGAGKVIAISPILEDEEALNYDMDRSAADITLAEFTRKGIELLDNSKGFFMMVEGGKIDWACHANDAAASIKDTLAFDAAINEAYSFYQKHPTETLIVVTGDHETGGLTIGFAGTGYSNYIDKIQYQKQSYVGFNTVFAGYKKNHTALNAKFDDVVPMIQDNFGLTVISSTLRSSLQDVATKGAAADATDADKAAAKAAAQKLGMALTDHEVKVLQDALASSMMAAADLQKVAGADLLYGGYEPLSVKLTTILNEKAGLGWTTYSHTGVPVQTSAIGVGQEQFNGYYDNTDIYKKMMALSGLQQ